MIDKDLAYRLELSAIRAYDDGHWEIEDVLIEARDSLKAIQVTATEGLQKIVNDGGIDSYHTARYTLERIIEMLER